MVNYRIKASAKKDLRRIYRYGVKKFGKIQADAYHREFFKCFEEIARQPYLYQSAEYIHEGYHRCVAGLIAFFPELLMTKWKLSVS